MRALFRRRLGGHVDDLNATVGRVHRCVHILRLGLAIADGDEIGAVDAVFLGEVALDGVGAALGQVLVIGFAADRIVCPATTKVEPRRLEFESALPSSCTAGIEFLLMSAEL